MDYKEILRRFTHFYRMNSVFIKQKISVLSFPQKLFLSVAALEAVILVYALAVPERGRICPVGNVTAEAFSLLKKSPTGKSLIRRVEKISKGSYVYVMLGETDKNDLIDYNGEVVQACTRTHFRYWGNLRMPKSIVVITNRDILGVDPKEIAKSIAFELENVSYSHQHIFDRFGKDSPLAAVTRERITQELGL